jgi:predicted ester cyclase
MSGEEIKANARRIIDEAWNKGNLEVWDEIYTADYVRHKSPFPDIEGSEAAKQFIVDCRTAYPDFQLTIDEIIAEGNTIVTRWTYQGTQTSQSPTTGASPTGKKVTFSGCTVGHYMGDKIVEEWEYGDYLGLSQQLGIVPSKLAGQR